MHQHQYRPWQLWVLQDQVRMDKQYKVQRLHTEMQIVQWFPFYHVKMTKKI